MSKEEAADAVVENVADDLRLSPEEEAAKAEMMEPSTAIVEPEPEPAKEEAKEPEKAAEPQEEPKKDKPPEGFVPHQAMHSEREGRKAAEALVAQMQQRLAELEARVPPQPEPEPEPIPDNIADPDAYNAWVQNQSKRLAEKLERIEREQQQAQLAATVQHHIQADEARVKAEKPDYADAMKFATDIRARHLKRLAPMASDAEIQQQIDTERLNLAHYALTNNMRPADVYYGIAQDYGWTGAPAAPAPTHDPAAQVQALNTAQQQTQSLATASAAAGRPEITIESLAKMDERQLAQIKRDRPDEVRRAMGG